VEFSNKIFANNPCTAGKDQISIKDVITQCKNQAIDLRCESQFLEHGECRVEEGEQMTEELPIGKVFNTDNSLIYLEELKSVKILTFSRTFMKFLPLKMEIIPNLEQIYASELEVKKISRETFKGLEKLKFLSLSKNKIEKIEENTFELAQNLKIIDLSFNQINSIEEKSLIVLKNLNNFFFNGNLCDSFDLEANEKSVIAVENVCGAKLVKRFKKIV
jgi:Leucine-rich repeat (LRR) protein